MLGPAAAAAAAEEQPGSGSTSMDWGEVLEQLQGSQEWGQLREELNGTAGGGALVAGLMQRALHAAAAAALQQQGQLAEPGQAVRQLVSAVQQAAWEKLHTGSWHEVAVVWRDAYSLASLLGAVAAVLWPATAAAAAAAPAAAELGQSQLGGTTPATAEGATAEAAAGAEAAAVEAAAVEAAAVEAALRQLDLAAIMGGPLLRPAVDALIDQLQARWEQLYTAQEAQQLQQAQRQRQRQQGPLPGSSGEEAPEPQGPALVAAGPAISLPPGSLGPRGTPVPLEELPSLERFWREYMNREGGPIPVLIDGEAGC